MAKKELYFKVNAEVKAAQKDLKDLKQDTQDVKDSIGLFGVTWGDVKNQFSKFKTVFTNGMKIVRTQIKLASLGLKQMFSGQIIGGAKTLFNVIKAGIASTGIGLLLVAFGSLAQYFSDSEKGASKFKEITAQLGVVVGNVTDIISDLGKSVFKLMTGDFEGFKEGLKGVKKGIGEFGEATSKEMAKAKQLEKDRLALQIFEREALVSKAKAEAEMMELRLKARDIENFTTEERLEFMRKANELAATQLEKDLHVAEEKLRFRKEENSYNKSTKENLDEEARLEAEVFRIKKSNFSERKRMKSEEIALVREQAAADKAALKAEEDAEKAKQAKIDEANKVKLDQEKQFMDKLLALENETTLALIENEQERANKQLEIQRDMEKRSIDAMAITEEQKFQLKKAADDRYNALVKQNAENTVEVIKLTEDQKIGIISNFVGAAAKLAGENKGLAVAESLINTYGGVTRALNDKTMPSTVGRIAMASTVLASGLANVKSIMSTPIKGAAGGGMPSLNDSSSKIINPRVLSGEFNLSAGENKEQAPIKAYVVTDEMTDSQNQLSGIRKRATI